MIRKIKLDFKDMSAYSFYNGIMINSNRYKGYAAISTSSDNNKISTKWMKIDDFYKSMFEDDKNHFIISLLLTSPIAIGFVFYAIILIYEKNYIRLLQYYFFFRSVFTLYKFICDIITDKNRNIRSRFHSSEHMVINAYKSLGYVPSIDEIKSFSRFDKNCSVNSITFRILTNASFALATTFIENHIVMLFVFVTAPIVIFVLLKSNHLNFLQRFTTSSPTDAELLLAIDCMRCWEENEKSQK